MAESPLESITRRETLGRLGKVGLGLAGLALASVPAVAQAFDWTIEQSYARSEPVYYVMPGLRYKEGKEGDIVRGEGTSLTGAEWKKYYFDDPEFSSKLQGLFRDLHGQVVSGGGVHYTFSFDRFHRFMEENVDRISRIMFYEKGFMEMGIKGVGIYSLPLPQDVTGTIITM